MTYEFLAPFKVERVASRKEIFLLASTLFSLPLYEAPKNVFSVVFLVAWIFEAFRTRSIGVSCPFNLPILGLSVILWISPLFSSYGDIITPLNSAPRWTLLALFAVAAARLNYTRMQFMIIASALMLGGVAAVLESFWAWHLNGKEYPEFRSVGHVNHSSMYSLIPLAVGLGAVYSRECWFKALGVITIAASLLFLPASRSLVGAAAITVILIVFASVATVQARSFRVLLLSISSSILFVFPVLMSPLGAMFRAEFVNTVTGKYGFAGRDKIFNAVVAVWDQHPFLGTGWFSFGTATSEEAVRLALVADGTLYDPNFYYHLPHGHNLWMTILIERGLVGVVLVTTLLLVYFTTFLPIALGHKQLRSPDRDAVLGALLVAVGFFVAGLGNTTMMNEHGHAGMGFIALVYGYLRGNRSLMHQIQ